MCGKLRKKTQVLLQFFNFCGTMLQWLSLLSKFIKQSLNLVFAHVQILLATCQIFAMVRISDDDPMVEIRLQAFCWSTSPQKQKMKNKKKCVELCYVYMKQCIFLPYFTSIKVSGTINRFIRKSLSRQLSNSCLQVSSMEVCTLECQKINHVGELVQHNFQLEILPKCQCSFNGIHGNILLVRSYERTVLSF